MQARWKSATVAGWSVALALIPAGVAGAATTETPVSAPTKPVLSTAAERVGRAATNGRDATVEQVLKAYWTEERMRSATPADRLPGLDAAKAAHQRASTGQARSRAMAAESAGPQHPAAKTEPAQPRSGSPVLAERNPLAGDPDYAASHFTARTAGKVYFTKAGGGNYVCSGTIVNSEGKSSVWTAGHCVHGGRGGTWHQNWAFVPSYKDGAQPYGIWSSRQLWTQGAWMNSSDFSSDIGVAIMNRNAANWRIADYLGGQGLAWNQSKRILVTAFGYPQAAPFDGQRIKTCTGVTFPEWEFFGISAQTLGLRCDMTPGSSGGGWLAFFNGWSGYLNGNNSYKYDNDPNTMYSPYYDDTASGLFAATRSL
jgi:hypothetical protein